jgi:tight adherence protein B
VPGEALALAAVDCPVLRDAGTPTSSAVTSRGSGGTSPHAPGTAGLGDLARAWQVSVQTGAPMAGPLEQVAASLSADQSLRAVVDGELSAPRGDRQGHGGAPGCGIGSATSWVATRSTGCSADRGLGLPVAGIVLACLGVLWIEALAQQSSR